MTSSLDPFQISNVAALFLPSVSSLSLSHYIEILNESRGKPSSPSVLAQGFECLRRGGLVELFQAARRGWSPPQESLGESLTHVAAL